MSAEATEQELTIRTAHDGHGSESVSIVEVQGIERMREVERLQTEIWGSDPAWVVPSHLLYIVAENGGIMLAAEVDDTMVGFVLGILGRQDGKLFHASHMLGIHPRYQQHGLGAALKWRQRDVALAQGLDLMTWTFDPLESRNAYFNLHKLGTITRTYKEDYYGQMPDALNQGLPSDRLLVEWHLRQRPFPHTITGSSTPIVVEQGGKPVAQLDGAGESETVAIPVPRSIQALKQDDPKLALTWRLAVRRAFSWALSQGFVAIDFRDGAYVLARQEKTA